jgi:hypothetical protein
MSDFSATYVPDESTVRRAWTGAEHVPFDRLRYAPITPLGDKGRALPLAIAASLAALAGALSVALWLAL